MFGRPRFVFLSAPVLLAACAAGSAARTEVIPIAPVKSPPLVVAVEGDGGATEKPACLSPDAREKELASAWPERDRVYFCLQPRDETGTPSNRTCSSVGRAGDLRHEAFRVGAPPPLPSLSFPKESANGKLTFRIEGGLLSPKKAVGVLEQKSPRKVLKRAPIEYDEHIAFEGFIGSAVVYRTWVDEGPGCSLTMVDPKKSWPSGVELEGGVGLGSCYEGTHLFRTRTNAVAVLDGGGSGLVFVNEDTLETTELDLERQAGPDQGTPFVGWLEGRVLVLVYGAPVSGAVVRVDLDRKEIVSDFSPTLCGARKPEPDTAPEPDP